MTSRNDSRPSFAEYFAVTMAEQGDGDVSKATVSIERGAELIRADRDGRASTQE